MTEITVRTLYRHRRIAVLAGVAALAVDLWGAYKFGLFGWL